MQTSPLSLSHSHIILVVSLSLLIQRECAHTGPQKRGSVLIEYGRRQGVPWSVVRGGDAALFRSPKDSELRALATFYLPAQLGLDRGQQ
jgi:hypothetical protein